ncbi:MAG: Rrf2 family transcriptional regulator [Bacteroidales bacterium]|jgi:Rrf2 family protein|nr:Rrf2 family transcriptional regulator [Bacteroidales bacterium]
MAKIVNITEAVSIALHSMVLVAKAKGKQMNATIIADVTGSSRYHVSKILQKLVRDGFLTSQRGPAGGFELVKKPEEITLLEIFEAIEGKIVVSKCPLNKACPFGECIFEDLTMRMTRQFRDYLNDHSLAHYAEGMARL